MKKLNDLSQLDKFIAIKNGYEPKKEKVKKEIWEVVYLGKSQFKGIYRDCVAFKNQFKGQKDYYKYVIK